MNRCSGRHGHDLRPHRGANLDTSTTRTTKIGLRRSLVVSSSSPTAQFGPNEWLVDEMYQRYLADPDSVDAAWHDFFADYSPDTAPDEAGAHASAGNAANGTAPPSSESAEPRSA